MKPKLLLFTTLLISTISTAQTWQWATHLGTAKDDAIGSIKISISDQIILAGILGDTLQFGNNLLVPPPGNYRYGFVGKCLSDGTPVWGRAIYTNKGNSAQNFLFGFTVSATPDNGIVLSSHFADTMILGNQTLVEAAGGTFVGKFDSSGNLLWARNFGQPNVPGSNSMQLSPNAVDVDGNIYLACAFTNTARFESDTLTYPNGTIYIVKYNKDGEEQWVRQCGPSNGWTRTYDLQVDYSGYLYLTGTISKDAVFGTDTLSVPPTRSIAYLAKMDNAGNFLWARKGGATTRNDVVGQIGSTTYGTSIATGDADRVYLTGFFMDTVQFGNQSLQPLCGNDYCTNFFLAAWDKSGNFKWVRQSLADNSGANGIDLLTDLPGNVYVAGGYFDQISFDGHTVSTDPAVISPDGFIARFDTNGMCQWMIDLNLRTVGMQLEARCPSADILVAHGWKGDPGDLGGLGLPFTTDYQGIIAALATDYDCMITGTHTTQTGVANRLHLYPNPVSNMLYVTIPEGYEKNSRLYLYNAPGQIILERSVTEGTMEIPVSTLNPGHYQVKVRQDGKPVMQGHFIKMK